jgi:hypothetical protein
MAPYDRSEIEDAFRHFQEVAATAGATGDWNPWAELFTEDAEYVEHLYGSFHGREAIRKWITDTMATPPNDEMTSFPVEWYVIDEARGWVLCAVWNRMQDIGDGEVHQAINWTRLIYAGGGLWSSEEDIYNPAEFGTMMKRYLTARDARA